MSKEVFMSIANPLTASNAITRVKPPTITASAKPNPISPDLGVFSDDILDISTKGLEKQQAETQINASQEISNIESDVVRVSSSIGRAKSLGNLSSEQAAALYKKIASLL